jgi:hypothetical protein
MAMTCHRIYSTGYNIWINETLKGDILSAPKGLVVGSSKGATSFGTSKGAFYGASKIASFGISKGDILRSGKNYDLHKKHCFTTSFADVDLEQLNIPLKFILSLICSSLSAITQLLVTYATTLKSLFQVPFGKQTKV